MDKILTICMKHCFVGEEEEYRWGSAAFWGCFPEGILYPQVLVMDERTSEKVLFEIREDLLCKDADGVWVPVLAGSAISGFDGRGVYLGDSPFYKAKHVRLPNTEELSFYERYSRL